MREAHVRRRMREARARRARQGRRPITLAAFFRAILNLFRRRRPAG